MVTRDKRNLKGATSPKPISRGKPTAYQQPIEQEQSPPPPPPPPKKEKHQKRTSPDQTASQSPSIDSTLVETPTQHHTTLPSAEDDEDAEDEADVNPRGSRSIANGTPPKLKLRLSPRVDSPADKRRRSRPRKNHASSPLVIAKPYTPLQTDSSSDGEHVKTPRRGSPVKAATETSRRTRPAKSASDGEFDLDMSEAFFGNPSGVMITWTDNEEESFSDVELEELKFQVEEQDLEELLAWGNNEVTLPGMPEIPQRDFWPQHGPFMELELDGSSSEDDHEGSDDSLDSGEEEEQMLAVRGLCGFGSDSDGDTTDSIDDTDHDGLVRFGIEQGEEQAASHRRVRKRAQTQPSVAGVPAAPVMGTFKSAVAVESAVLKDAAEPNAGPVMSPFSTKKVRVLRRKAASDTSPSRRRTNSIASSSQSTASAPSQIEHIDLTSPSPISDIPEEEEEVFMDLDLDDILESTALHAEFDFDVADSDEPDLTDIDGLTNGQSLDLSRWNRIPIGAYRSSRSPLKAEDVLPPAMRLSSIGLGDSPMYFPIANLLSTRETITLRVPWQYGRKRKITRQEAIGLSPIMCPIRPERSGSSMKSRKQKRADRKAVKRSHLVAPAQSEAGASTSSQGQLERTGTDVPDSEVPPLDLPGASEPVPAPRQSAPPLPSPVDLLPIPTLPSAECFPLDSPLFSAVRTQPIPHTFNERLEPDSM